MARRELCIGVFVLVLLMASSALATGGGWRFVGLTTINYTAYPPPYDVDGRIYMPDGTTLVAEGSLLQIIIGLNGADIVDPIEYFDDPANGGNGSKRIDSYSEELAWRGWVRGGADPADISGGTNVLAYGTLGFTGEFALTSPGAIDWFAPAGSEPIVANGVAQDKFAWRAWSQPKEVLLAWDDSLNYPEFVGCGLWYTDGRELGTHSNDGGGPDTGWWIGMPTMALGGDVTSWGGMHSPIGAEVYDCQVYGIPDRRSQDRLDHYLGYFVPEPSSMLLVGSALILVAARGRRKRKRAAVE